MPDFGMTYAPTTFNIGFLEIDLDAVVKTFTSWIRQLHHTVHVVDASGEVSAVIASLEPLTMPPRRSLWLRTRSLWTAYVDNSILGTDALSSISYLSKLLGCRGVILSRVPHTLQNDADRNRGTYGAVQFEMYGPSSDDPLECVRSVGVTFDGGRWYFDQSGSVQPFEEVDRYKSQRIVDRLTPEMLDRYAFSLGIDAFNEMFYTGDARLVSYANPANAPARQCSLAEARRDFGLA
ncbi:MAG: hypothetical protein DWQ37_00230 [Planctomycetota bacterium]|nr:MAG: hypothetical protein DWQ37_00230 [Planctomycetota bacterium]